MIRTCVNAELANTMLEKAYLTLTEEEHPIVHSDRGSHYRWPPGQRCIKTGKDLKFRSRV